MKNHKSEMLKCSDTERKREDFFQYVIRIKLEKEKQVFTGWRFLPESVVPR